MPGSGGVHTVHPAGDEVALVYDPKGLAPPRGVEGATSVTDALTGLAGWVASLLAACVIAVVRSFRLLDHPVAPVLIVLVTRVRPRSSVNGRRCPTSAL
ncbi:hypothetical protein NGM36_36980 [Streptomyces mutabilis]|uniref:hypothetical protein n=1 Tax=Streptomyces mutabilis TaxID=67332 RepID=UPI0022BA2E93|nr:hypothetical protein [Streptomyces mutabilis]MCZ9355281.1 hypothetical protein [Streptomyces mutabilis]